MANYTEKEKTELFILVAFVLIAIELGIILAFQFSSVSMVSLIAGLGSITFFGMLTLGFISSSKIDTGEARRAITGTATVIYLTLLCVIAFTDLGPSDEQQTWIIHDFTIIYGIIVGAYFGTKTIEKRSTLKYYYLSTKSKTELTERREYD